ncbi:MULTISPECIES: HDOD domain-containing protein [unclassified Pseudodesulfovibrio]|uniref:HDOD domain-containing protein n=1 Tax=unclassified Pseudodesulfovibrio TaxID=2661612 RepID=UPI000FEBFAAF|nr:MULTISPECIES: HDOD domain-containing protein [unclassified Pseudodesulfovibrio]MCJ2162993.1 HDOD domain-containing protein [Pseudodesulfovibrio sp. S3-i]RWU06990.1 HDOD domain-containing protein [Pseudodesulfovibrio sp. S3]
MNQNSIQGFLQELPNMREDLPFAPEVLKKLFIQTGGGSLASLEDVGETLSRDQGLTTRILSLANSAYYGLQAEVQSVPRAAAVLGMSEIRNIVLALGVKGLTRKYPIPAEFDLGAYWTHQFLVAMVAKELSHMIGVGKPDNMFTSGLLHDIGKLITALKRPDDWQAIRDLAENDEMLDSEAEEEYWGLDHAVVGALVLRSWDLPADLVEPVNWHHSPALAPDHSNESNVICLADAVTHAVADPDGPYVHRVDLLCEEISVDMDDILEIAEELFESDDVEQFVSILS